MDCIKIKEVLDSFSQISYLSDSPSNGLETFGRLKLKSFKSQKNLTLTTRLDSLNIKSRSLTLIGNKRSFEELYTSEFLEKYEIFQQIGSGKQGKVYKVLNKQTKKWYAAKIINFNEDENISKFLEEIEIMRQINHQNIVKYIEHFIDEKTCQIIYIMECVNSYSLKHHLKENTILFDSEEKIKKIIKNLMEVLIYLHQNKIMHRDIKLTNILINEDDYSIKLIDFGVSKKFREGELSYSPNGDNKFHAPEILKYSVYSEKSDIWSAGLVFLSLLNGVSAKTKTTMKCIKDNGELALKKIDRVTRDLLNLMLRIDPKERITSEEALKHPWFEL